MTDKYKDTRLLYTLILFLITENIIVFYLSGHFLIDPNFAICVAFTAFFTIVVVPFVSIILVTLIAPLWIFALSIGTQVARRANAHSSATDQLHLYTELGYRQIEPESHVSTVDIAASANELLGRQVATLRLQNSTVEHTIYLYETIGIARYSFKNGNLPKIFVNSHLNDASKASLKDTRSDTVGLDLGSDFGKYVTVITANENKLEALEIFDPNFMILWLSAAAPTDAVISSSYVEFRYNYDHIHQEIGKFLAGLVAIVTKLELYSAQNSLRTLKSSTGAQQQRTVFDAIIRIFIVMGLVCIGYILALVCIPAMNPSIHPIFGKVCIILLLAVYVCMAILFYASFFHWLDIFIHFIKMKIVAYNLRKSFAGISNKYS